MRISDLELSLQHPNIKAFLHVIRAGESSQDDTAYSIMFGGEHFTDFSRHPGIAHMASGYTSTAAGAYQFLSKTWANLVKQYQFTDFSPHSQDLGAVALIYGRGALQDVISGNFQAAIASCCREWASLPGSPYGQPTRSYEQALSTYHTYGGITSSQIHTEPVEETPMVPFIPILASLLPSLLEAIPKLKALFPGSEVSERNVKAATLAFDVAQKALGAVNAQQVVEKLQDNPTAVEAVSKAIEDNWLNLTEVGGGIVEARKNDLAFIASKAHVWDSPSFWAMCLMLPLVYFVMGGVVGVWGKLVLSGEVTASIITGAITLVLGGIAGFYFGSTTTRNKPSQ
jgi:muramidase (phage lysozyme)